MEWLIIYRQDEITFAGKAKEMLKRYGLDAAVLSAGQTAQLDDENINLKIKNASHIIILDKQLLKEDSAAFFYGYLTARASKVFTLRNEWSGHMSYFKNVSIFTGEEQLFENIENHIEEIRTEAVSRQAFNDLFFEGIPFTADCFADCVAKDQRETCQKFIMAGIDINCRTSQGIPMLNIAIRAEQNECAKWLMSHNLNIDAIANDRGYSALMDAVWKNNLEIARVLVDKGARIDFISRDGQSVLILAVGTGNHQMCSLLAQAGADPDFKDEMGMSAYDYAKLFKRKDIVDVLDKYHKE